MNSTISLLHVEVYNKIAGMEEDISKWLKEVRKALTEDEEVAARSILRSAPKDLFKSEIARRTNEERKVRKGKPKEWRPCPKCGVEFGAREMRKHKPRCDGGK